MNTELQNKVWSVLPKEFKEEVKELYDGCIKMMDIRPSASQIYVNKLSTLEDIFGHHNLTSDAEVEEMLCVSREDMQFYYQYYKAKSKEELSAEQKAYYKGRTKVLLDLFGSKCLPDNVATSEPNVDSSVGSVENLEPKPAEPKFKVGDKVKDISSPHDGGVYTVDDIKKSSDGFIYHIQGLIGKSNVKESDLEPYTEPKTEDSELLHADSVKETRIADEETHLCNLSQENANCDKQFDNILKDSLSKERRLNIAASIAAGWLARHGMTNPETIAMDALAVADALIIEVEKTNNP